MLAGQVGRVYISRLHEGQDLLESIREHVEKSSVKAGFFIVIGSLRNVVLGYYKNAKYDYTRLEGPLEIDSGMGDIATGEDGQVIIHAHVVVSGSGGQTFGGHLAKESYVGVTAELIIVEAAGVKLERTFDEKLGLNLLKLD